MRVSLRRLATYASISAAYITVSYLAFLSSVSIENSAEVLTQARPPVSWQRRRDAVTAYCHASPLELARPRQLRGDTARLPEAVRRHFTTLYNNQLTHNLVHVPSLNLLWCLVPKVASTSVSRLLLPWLGPRRGPPQDHAQGEVWARAGRLQHGRYLAAANTTPAFLITRHPFARVASAFRNKLEDRRRSHDGEYFYKTYSSQIARLCRGSWRPGDPEPTFPEFVRFLINTEADTYDEHWQPVASRCRLCQVTYTHILHYETLAGDWRQLLEDLSLDTAELQLPWENKGGGGGELREYFGLIGDQQQMLLYEKYEADFKLFGYSLDDDF